MGKILKDGMMSKETVKCQSMIFRLYPTGFEKSPKVLELRINSEVEFLFLDENRHDLIYLYGKLSLAGTAQMAACSCECGDGGRETEQSRWLLGLAPWCQH